MSVFFKDFILNDIEVRLGTSCFVGVQFPWENLDEAEFHKLISIRNKNNYKQYYLFNYIKIFQKKDI